MDHEMNGKRTHTQSNKRELEVEQNTHQEIIVLIYLFVYVFDYV